MKIKITLFSSFSKYLPENTTDRTLHLEFNEGAKVKDVLQALKIPLNDVRLLVVNGTQSKPEDDIHNGDRIDAFPPLSGG